MTHIVTAPLVVARDEDGRDVYLYRGSTVPRSLSEAEVKRLVEGNFIGEVEQTEPEGAPEGDPAESWKVDQLKAYAAERSIDLGDATKKADILAAIDAAKA